MDVINCDHELIKVGYLLRVAKYIGDLLRDNHMGYLLYVDDCLFITMVYVSLDFRCSMIS